jgi:hypothetical protein
MTQVEKIVNYASIGLILILGILFISGVVGFLDSTYRFGFGIVIIIYGAIRLAMTLSTGRRRTKKP